MLINITKINLNPNVGGGKPIELENKEITITENGTTTVTPSEGFGGMSNVNITTDVPTPKIQVNKSISITENGSYSVTPSTGYVGVGDVDINVFVSEIGTSIDFSEIGYDATDNANANMIIQDGINYAKQIQTEYTDSKRYSDVLTRHNIIYFPYVDTSNRTSFLDMFVGCSSMQVIPPLTISNKCTDLSRMFHQCGALKSIDTTNWDTSNVISLRYLFSECRSLKEIIGTENWDVSKVTNMDYLFKSCEALTELNLSGWNFSNLTSLPGSFWDYTNSLETLNLTNCNFSTFTTFEYFLKDKYELKKLIGVENLVSSNATSLRFMFSGCNNLTNIDVSNWNTSNVTDMRGIFNSCTTITELDLSNWNTDSLMYITMASTSNQPFYNMKNLQRINLSGWNTSKITDLSYLFYNCEKLTEIIGIENWNTNNVTALTSMLFNCKSLTDLNLSGWNLINCTNYGNSFSNFSNELSLTNFQAPQNINATIDFSYCKLLTVDSLLSILNNLTDRTSTTSMKCTLGTTNLNKLTDEQKAIATNKNWVLA